MAPCNGIYQAHFCLKKLGVIGGATPVVLCAIYDVPSFPELRWEVRWANPISRLISEWYSFKMLHGVPD